MDKQQTVWTDADGTHHIVTMEERGPGYVVRLEMNMRGGSSASWEHTYSQPDDARDAFAAESKAVER